MFEQATLTAAPWSTRLWSTCAGISGQALIVGCLILAPLLSPAVLPQIQSYVGLVAPGPPPAPPPPPPASAMTVRPRPVAHTFRCTFCAPIRVPEEIPNFANDPPEVADPGPGVQGGVPGGVPGGVYNGVIGGILEAAAPPPPAPKPAIDKPAPPPSAPAVIPRHRVGGLVKLAAPIRRVDPVYPALARQARLEGVVQLECVVGVDGRIHDIKVVSGHPFFVKAAIDAVRQWVYSPGTLNGDLVEVIAPITVTFRLGAN
jgi:protein TonB